MISLHQQSPAPTPSNDDSNPQDGKTTRERGQWAEQLAMRHLEQQGLRTITKNYLCRRGEIDLIMQRDSLLLFVEVRYRKHKKFGTAEESIDFRKQKRLGIAARHFLQTHPSHGQCACRFDVVIVNGAAGSTQIKWIQDAFQA
jgi:putative endonuclease